MTGANVPGIEEFIKWTLEDNAEVEDLRVFSYLNDDKLVEVSVFYRLNGIKYRRDMLVGGALIGEGLATDAVDEKARRKAIKLLTKH